MHVSEGPGSTPEISSKANPQLKFPPDFLLNPGQNPVASQDPFGQSKQPTLNIPSGSQLLVGDEKRVWRKGCSKMPTIALKILEMPVISANGDALP
ncbi:hypothetical protein O181_045920 [Austropuccinia psidii MF-1]|uniref:Uncharacterized protein n=1 Tax=Austropuccinia psidii MF-1 TaxID=1389203 RepID=A0A9Q3DMJ1_9BASI|nr:hypothetical protein [Austropuccinia psidii MF-1]